MRDIGFNSDAQKTWYLYEFAVYVPGEGGWRSKSAYGSRIADCMYVSECAHEQCCFWALYNLCLGIMMRTTKYPTGG